MEIIKADIEDGDVRIPEKKLERIISELEAGRLIVYPTETVYGLGCDPFDETAVKRVYMAKRRPFDMPMSIAVKDLKMMEEITVLDERAKKLVKKFMPGPLTLIVTKGPSIPDILTASSNEIGIRIPEQPVALKLIETFGPIVSTSANIHSHKDNTTCQDAMKDLGSSVSIYVDGGPCKLGRPSTIIQVTDGQMNMIRQGTISPKEIEAALNE